MNKIKVLISILIFGLLFSFIPSKVLANDYSSDYFKYASTNHVANFDEINVVVSFFTGEVITGDSFQKRISYIVANPFSNTNTLFFKVNYYNKDKKLLGTCENNKKLSLNNESSACQTTDFKNDSEEVSYYRVFISIDKKPVETSNIENNGMIVDNDPSNACTGEYCITKYVIDMKVNEDNSYNITEKITAYYNVSKHGIFRKLPLKNQVVRNDGSTSSNRAKISDIKVDAKFETSNESGYKVIKIGDADKLLTGEHTYTISYKYDIGRDKAKNFDELYFNIIGTEWDASISNVEFSIEMPKEFDHSKVGFSTGIKGTIGSTEVEHSIDSNFIKGKFNGTLKPSEGITVRIELPEGYYKYVYKFNYFNLLLIIIPIIFAFLSFKIFRENGIDDMVIETVEFYPPKGYNSLDIGYFYKDRADSNDVVSLLIYLANKGYIKITDRDESGNLLKHKNFIITKIKDYDGKDSREEEFLNDLFKKQKIVSLFGKSDDNNEVVNQVEKKDLMNRFYTTVNSIISKTNTKEKRKLVYEEEASKKANKIYLFILISIIILYASYVVNGIDFNTLFSIGIFSILGLLMLLYSFGNIFAYFMDKNQFSKTNNFVGGVILLLFIGGLFTFIFSMEVSDILLYDKIYLIIVIISILIIAFMFACRLSSEKRTKFGVEILGKIRGFKNFLDTAEKEKLETLVEEDPTYFYNILPYTYVLGVSKKWISKFEGITLEPPSWYDTNGAVFNAAMMSSFMDTTMVSAASSLSSSPGGDGGGGSSGGGSGGGGGGSW